MALYNIEDLGIAREDISSSGKFNHIFSHMPVAWFDQISRSLMDECQKDKYKKTSPFCIDRLNSIMSMAVESRMFLIRY